MQIKYDNESKVDTENQSEETLVPKRTNFCKSSFLPHVILISVNKLSTKRLKYPSHTII